jgi:hypothetical protein
LSQLHGEQQAVAMVKDLSPQFRGLLPKSLLDACRNQRG